MHLAFFVELSAGLLAMTDRITFYETIKKTVMLNPDSASHPLKTSGGKMGKAIRATHLVSLKLSEDESY